MYQIPLSTFLPSARSLVCGLRVYAAAVALHGMLVWLSTAIKFLFPDAFDLVGSVVFWVLAVPAFFFCFHLYFLGFGVDECLWMVRIAEAAGHCLRIYDMGCRCFRARSNGSTVVKQKLTCQPIKSTRHCATDVSSPSQR